MDIERENTDFFVLQELSSHAVRIYKIT